MTQHTQSIEQGDAPAKKEKVTYCYKLFRVKRADGRVTTVSMDPGLAIRAANAIGGFPSVGRLVRKVALQYEDGTFSSCSGFVSHKVRQELEKAQRERKAKAQATPPTRELATAP